MAVEKTPTIISIWMKLPYSNVRQAVIDCFLAHKQGKELRPSEICHWLTDRGYEFNTHLYYMGSRISQLARVGILHKREGENADVYYKLNQELYDEVNTMYKRINQLINIHIKN